MLDAISSGSVCCHCFTTGEQKQADQLGHASGCLWQRYMEEIYRIGRVNDESTLATALSGALMAAENLQREALHYELRRDRSRRV